MCVAFLKLSVHVVDTLPDISTTQLQKHAINSFTVGVKEMPTNFIHVNAVRENVYEVSSSFFLLLGCKYREISVSTYAYNCCVKLICVVLVCGAVVSELLGCFVQSNCPVPKRVRICKVNLIKKWTPSYKKNTSLSIATKSPSENPFDVNRDA
jgi:hypothetical protein